MADEQGHGPVTAATVVDHIKPHKGDAALFFCYANTQSLCADLSHEVIIGSRKVDRTQCLPEAANSRRDLSQSAPTGSGDLRCITLPPSFARVGQSGPRAIDTMALGSAYRSSSERFGLLLRCIHLHAGCGWELEHCRALTLNQTSEENDFSARKLQRIVMGMRIGGVDFAKSRHSLFSFPVPEEPEPRLVPHYLVERQFGSGKQAYSDVWFTNRRKTARNRATEAGIYQLIADLCRSGCRL